jgi:hypothetical protein
VADDEADLDAASRHEHLVVYDPAAIPPGTPFDPDMDAPEPEPLPEAALRALAATGSALVLHFPVEDCEATVRILSGDAPPHLRERGRRVLSGARLRVPSGSLKADGAEFVHGPFAARAAAAGRSAKVAAGDREVTVFDLVPWKTAHRASLLRGATTPAARRADVVQTVVAITGAVLIPVNLFLVPILLAVAWKRAGIRAALVALAAVALVDGLVLGAAWALEALRRRRPELGGAAEARLRFERENPDVLVCLAPWRGGAGAPAWTRLGG